MCSVGCGVVNWSLGVVFRFNVVRRSSRCVVSRGCVLLGHLSYSCLAWGRVILRGCGVVARGSISCGVIIWSLVGVVIGRLGVVTGCCECCRCVVRRRCSALVSTIHGRHWYTSDRPRLQRYDKRQQHNPVINYAVKNLNINIQYGTSTDKKQIIDNSIKQNIYPIAYW
jgi:hypothetical protein